MVWRVFLAAGADPGCLQAHIRLDSSPYCLCEPFSSLLAYPALQPHPSRPFLGDLFAWAAPWHPIPRWLRSGASAGFLIAMPAAPARFPVAGGPGASSADRARLGAKFSRLLTASHRLFLDYSLRASE